MKRHFDCPNCGEPAFTFDTHGWDHFVECPHCHEWSNVYDDEAGPIELEHVIPCNDCEEYRTPESMVGSRCPACARESWNAAADQRDDADRERALIDLHEGRFA